MYVWLDVRFDLIFNVNKVGRLNECIFIYFMYNKKIKIRCKVVISMVFNEN